MPTSIGSIAVTLTPPDWAQDGRVELPDHLRKERQVFHTRQDDGSLQPPPATCAMTSWTTADREAALKHLKQLTAEKRKAIAEVCPQPPPNFGSRAC